MDAALVHVGANHHGFKYLPVEERLQGDRRWREFTYAVSLADLQKVNTAHCTDCGIPFCHDPVLDNRSGCPIENIIPEFNLAVRQGHWRLALHILSKTNNFPEFTGRLCPAPCEAACTQARFDMYSAVTIEQIERAIVENGFAKKWVEAQAPAHLIGKTVAVVGSGPAGLACAQQLARQGYSVTVYEKSDEPGGLLRYGIPNFKMEKWVVARRIEQMKAEGVKFICGADVGVNISARDLANDYDAVVLAGGAQTPRDASALDAEGKWSKADGRNLKGIHFAMEFLGQDNWRQDVTQPINANGKHVIVIGGGDTGSDCIGTSLRQGAASITQVEILQRPPEKRTNDWPVWPNNLTTSSSQEEGLELGILTRLWAVNAQSFQGDGRVENMKLTDVQWVGEGRNARPQAIEGSERSMKADLVVIAAGFTGPKKEGMLTELGVPFNARGNVEAKNYHVPHPEFDNIFVAGDMGRGQSLIVWGIHEGRDTANVVDKFLMSQDSVLIQDMPEEMITRAAQYAEWAANFTRENHFALTLT